MRGGLSGPAQSCLVPSTRLRVHAKIGSLRQAAVRLKPAQLQQILVRTPTKALGYLNRAQPSRNECSACFTCTASSARNPSPSSSSFQPNPAVPRLASSIIISRASHLTSSIGSSAISLAVHQRRSAVTACQALLLFPAWCRPAHRLGMTDAASSALSCSQLPGSPGRRPHSLTTNAGTTLSPSPASQRLGRRCNGYVGEGTAPAGEYHHADFSWEDHCKEVLALVASHPVKWRHLAHDILPNSSPSSYPLPAQQDSQESSRRAGNEIHESQPLGAPHSTCPTDETQNMQPSDGLQSSSTSTVKAHDAQQSSGLQSSSQNEALMPDGADARADNSACNREGSHQVHSRPADARSFPVSASKQILGNATGTSSPPEASSQEQHQGAGQPSMLWDAVSSTKPASQKFVSGPRLQAEQAPDSNQPDGLVSQRREHVLANAGQEVGGNKGYSSSRWEAFHAQDNRSGRFYKERRWASGAVAGFQISILCTATASHLLHGLIVP